MANNVKESTTLSGNKKVASEKGFFKGLTDTISDDMKWLGDTSSRMTGPGKISDNLDKSAKAFHNVTGGSILKTGLRAAVYGGGLLAAADFLNPFSLGWND